MTTMLEQPLLGLATTRELLEEIRARGEVSHDVGEYPEEMGGMAIGAANLLDTLPGSMLDYRPGEPSPRFDLEVDRDEVAGEPGVRASMYVHVFLADRVIDGGLSVLSGNLRREIRGLASDLGVEFGRIFTEERAKRVRA